MANNKLKSYSITSQITGGALSLKKLDGEIAATALVNDYATVTKEGDNVCVWGDSLANETSLDNLVAAHVAYSEGEDETKLSTKELRDKMISEDLSNWGSLSTDRKKELVQCFVWPNTATPAELDALHPQEDREQMICDTVHLVVTDTAVIKSTDGGLKYWREIADASGVMSTEELKSDEVF